MNNERYVAVDVETANYWLGSICQIGAAVFEGGQLVEEWETLVNPGVEFEGFHSGLHGINAANVDGAPRFTEALDRFMALAGDSLIVSYGHFDRSAFSQACVNGGLEAPQNTWLNVQSVVKRAWPDRYGKGGFRLNMVAKYLDIPLPRHHNAIDDARAAGLIFAQACAHSGIPVADWIKTVRRPISTAAGPDAEVEVNPDGLLFGEHICFTGALAMPRRQAQALAGSVGCAPQAGVTKKTTLLVVGDQDLSKLIGNEKSSKHLKAEQLIAAGQEIRIIGETDFITMINIEGVPS